MDEEIKIRDEQLQELDKDLKELFIKITNTKKQAECVAEIKDKVADYQNALDSFKMEIRSQAPGDKAIYKTKAKVFRDNLKQYRNDLSWQERVCARDALLGDAHQEDPDLESSEGLMSHGLNIQQSSKESLQRTMAVTAEAQVIGRETAVKLESQTAQLENVYDNLESMESAVKRSKKIITRMARKVTTDKYIWIVVFLVIVAIVFVIVWKSVYPETNVNMPEQMRIPG